MLKPQDCIILLKFIANSDAEWSQRGLAKALIISLSEINAGIKRLITAGLLKKDNRGRFSPIFSAADEFLVNGLKYMFSVKLGEYTRGIPTGIAAPLFRDKIALGHDPIPVWPDARGDKRGVALQPIYPTVSKALRENPDQNFYELLVLIDAIRIGRPRERNLAIKLLRDKLKHEK